MCSNFKVATENESNCDTASHFGQTNHHVLNTGTCHTLWLCVHNSSRFITFLSAQPLEQMREKGRGRSDHFFFTWAAVLTPVFSDHVHYKTTVSGGRADLITAIKCGTAGAGLWTCVVVFFAVVVTVFDSGKCSVNSRAGVRLWNVCMQWWKRLSELRTCKVNQWIRKKDVIE